MWRAKSGRGRWWCGLALAWCGAGGVMSAQPPASTPSETGARVEGASALADAERVARWSEDIDACVNGLLARHKNPTQRVSSEALRAAGEQLKGQIAAFDDARLNLGIMAICALVGDAHTTASLGVKGQPYRSLPLDTAWLSEGVFVLGTRTEDARFLGGKIVAIGGVPIEEVTRRLGTVISHENDGWVRQQARSFVRLGDVLRALDLSPSGAEATFSIVRPGESRAEDLTLKVLQQGERPRLSSAVDAAAPGFALTLKPRVGGVWYGHRLLEDSRTLYVWYDRCQDQAGLSSVSAWTQEVFKVIDEQKPARVVIDLRRNGGGNSALLGVMELGIAQRQKAGAALPVKVLIGRGTFSSGMMNAIELKNLCGATLIGSPTGGKPNAYGEIQSFTLPHSGITVTYCTKLFKRWPEDVDAVPADVEVEMTWADFVAGRDVVMERALKE